MSGPVATAVTTDEVAHLALKIGRLLLANGDDTAEVQAAVTRFAQAFGGEASVVVNYEAVIVTVALDNAWRTKVGHRVPAMNVGLGAVASVNRILAAVETDGRDLAWVSTELERIEHAPAFYSRWIVVVAMGLTAASLARLFGADWGTFGVVWVAGSVGMWLRQELARRDFNLVFIPFAAALVSGSVGGLGVLFGWAGSPALCLVAPGMIIVPGVPLINGVQDLIRNHVSVGLARLAFGAMVTVAIAFGLYGAMVITGVRIPVDAPMAPLPVAIDALFSALAAVGYAALFGVPPRIAWACLVCGVASHALRTLLMHAGVQMVAATLVGALAVGFLAQIFARRFRAPAATFAFPGVVAMVPGSFAFRAVVGSLEIVAAGAHAAPTLVAETLSLYLSCVLMTAAIAVGLAAPLIIWPSRSRAAA
ncbi:MAG TPA: threonine/serine exporter family protein [Burkholderiales bacterium]|nr:threonine/serine exporter family protein [Betaproteobacteria bacterium]HQR52569.1 threonine/serine exporter family protein [Burkholderiales bacterium]